MLQQRHKAQALVDLVPQQQLKAQVSEVSVPQQQPRAQVLVDLELQQLLPRAQDLVDLELQQPLPRLRDLEALVKQLQVPHQLLEPLEALEQRLANPVDYSVLTHKTSQQGLAPLLSQEACLVPPTHQRALVDLAPPEERSVEPAQDSTASGLIINNNNNNNYSSSSRDPRPRAVTPPCTSL